eukprot:763057-Hanusia_phi.AAC.2
MRLVSTSAGEGPERWEQSSLTTEGAGVLPPRDNLPSPYKLLKMMEKCSVFQTKLEEFARKHKSEIVRNPDFRSKFNSMCAAIGVDPLACDAFT